MKFLNMQGSPLSGAITITDNLARPAVSDGNRKAFASGGYRAFDQKKGGMAIVFNSNPPDNKPLLNTLIHEIGHIKWPGLGNDSEKHDPLFYALLNNALQKLGVSVDPQQDLQGQSIENVKIPQKAIDDPLSYIINNNRSELVPGIDSAQAAGDRWGVNVSSDGSTMTETLSDSAGTVVGTLTFNYDGSGNIASRTTYMPSSNTTINDMFQYNADGSTNVDSIMKNNDQVVNEVQSRFANDGNSVTVTDQDANITANNASVNFSAGSSGRLIGDFDDVTVEKSSQLAFDGQSGTINAQYASLTLNSGSSATVAGTGNTIDLTPNTGSKIGVAGQSETVTGDSGSNNVNIQGDGTTATVNGGGTVGLINNQQTLTLGDSGSTVNTAPGA
jgi:hypothetical protein